MLAVKVVMEGSVCCACTGGVRVFPFAASHGRWLVEEFMMIGFVLMCSGSRNLPNSYITISPELFQ
jgi:hypothetical protein